MARSPFGSRNRNWNYIISQMERDTWYALDTFDASFQAQAAVDYAKNRLLQTRLVTDPKTLRVTLEVRLP